MLSSRNRLNLTRMIPSPQTLMNLTRNRLNLTPLTRTHLNLTQLIRILSSRNRLNLIRLNLTPMNRTLMIRIRTRQTRLQDSQFLPNRQTDKRKKGLGAPKEIVNEGTSLTHLLNRPALTPIVRDGKLACVPFDLPSRTRHLSARMRRSDLPLRANATMWLRQLGACVCVCLSPET
ncbi:MAG: hypothetical protein ABSE36_04755 [Terracidiphilus sp.]|jgi:hypothetical protein